MKKCKLILVLFSTLLLSYSSFSQLEKGKIDWGNFAMTAGAGLAAGGFEGAMDGLNFHNTSNDPFWGQNSWTNKYRNHDPAQGQTFRGKYLTFTTDGWHLMKFGRNLFTAGAVAIQFTGKKERWYIYVLKGATFWVFRGIGFNLVYKQF